MEKYVCMDIKDDIAEAMSAKISGYDVLVLLKCIYRLIRAVSKWIKTYINRVALKAGFRRRKTYKTIL